MVSPHTFIVLVLAALVSTSVTGCNNSGFGSGTSLTKRETGVDARGKRDGNDNDQNDRDRDRDRGRDRDRDSDSGRLNDENDSSTPSDLVEEGGNSMLKLGYEECRLSANSGKVGYPGKCAADSVMVAINDGKTQEMTCCPLTSKNVLSTNAADLWIERSGQCNSDEVGTGMIAASGSRIYCSKLNDKLTVKSSETSMFVRRGTSLGDPMDSLAEVYNLKDLCFCPKGSILIGNHSTNDNDCRDMCVHVGLK